MELEAGGIWYLAMEEIVDDCSLQVNESALTGESHQCRKDTRQSAGGSAAGRPQKHGILRNLAWLVGTRTGFASRASGFLRRSEKNAWDDDQYAVQ